MSFSDNTLAEFVKVDEEFADANTVFGDARLNSLLDIVLVTEHAGWALVITLVAVS